ncbi:MAG: FecR family protein [Leptospiraceae bacterium]|nr:FecR family protein [Leptospiraceae bacterium]
MKNLFILILLFVISTCKKEENVPVAPEAKQELSAQVLFVLGDVMIATSKAKLGDEVKLNDLIKVGKKSTVDIQIKDTETTIRIKENSEFSFNVVVSGQKKKISAKVNNGSALLNIQKLKQDDSFDVKTPTQLAGVRGTKFEVNVDSQGKTKTTVFEGKVSAKVRSEELETLSQDDINKSANLTKLASAFEATEVVLEKGQTVQSTKETKDKILKESGLAEVIKNITPEKIAEIDTKIDPKKTEDKLSKLSTTIKQKPETMKETEIASKLKEYEELIAIETAKLSKEGTKAIAERNTANKEIIMKRIETIMGKQAETLVLKDGRKIRGVILQEEERYIVLSPDGKLEFEAKDVESTEF